MDETDLFLSYSSTDLVEAEKLESWLQAPPRNRSVWRDRRGIQPGAPDFYPPIRAGIVGSATFVVLLSPRWLKSEVAEQEFLDAQTLGKKILLVVHSAISRDPETDKGRRHKTELDQALQTSSLAYALKTPNWIWLTKNESADPDYDSVESAIATDFSWAVHHRIIGQRLSRWKELQNEAVLLRGSELVELLEDALKDEPGRQPILTSDERNFLSASQRHEEAERTRVEGLYRDAQARALAFAAKEQSETAPDVALLLAAEAARVAAVSEARGILLSLLDQYVCLTKVLHDHGRNRMVSGVTFSPDGQWLASIDRDIGLGDNRLAQLLIHDTQTGRLVRRISSDTRLSAIAWGVRWLALTSKGSIGWIRWDEWKEKFIGNTPTTLEPEVLPDYLAFSPPSTDLPQGEILAWGTEDGNIGLIRVGDHERWQGRLNDNYANNSLTGLSWLNDGRLLTAESGRILIRPFPSLEPAQEIAALGRVFSLSCNGEQWVASCVKQEGLGLLLGRGENVEQFIPAERTQRGLIASWSDLLAEGRVITNPHPWHPGLYDPLLCPRGTPLTSEVDPIGRVASDQSGRFLATGWSVSGRVGLWDRYRWSHLIRIARPGSSTRCIAVSSTGATALASHDGHILLFESDLNDEPTVDVVASFLPDQLLYTDGGRTLLCVAETGQLVRIDQKGDMRDLQWPKDLGTPREIVAAADRPILAARCSDNGFTILRLTESELKVLHTFDVGMIVRAVALDSAGMRVYTVVEHLGRKVVSWLVDAPEKGFSDVVGIHQALQWIPLAFSAGDLVVIGDGSDVIFTRTDNSDQSKRCRGHEGEEVRRIAAAGSQIVSCSTWYQSNNADELQIWTMKGENLGPVIIPEHTMDIVMYPNGQRLLVLGQSGNIFEVTLNSQDWINIANRIAGRDLTKEEQHRYGIDAWRERLSKPD